MYKRKNSCHFYTLKPINFAQTYCFTIFTPSLLIFRDIGSLWCGNQEPIKILMFIFYKKMEQIAKKELIDMCVHMLTLVQG